MVNKHQYQIYISLFVVMVFWGFNVIATKLLVTSFMPVTMTAFRIFTAAVGVFIILFSLKLVRKPTKKEWQYIIICSLFNVVGHHYFLSIGLKETSASNGGLILGTGPILTTILAFLFLRNKITILRFCGIILGFIGISFIVFQNGESLEGISLGDVHVFLSIFVQAVSFIMIKKVSSTLDPRLMTGYMLFIGSLLLFIISLIVEPAGLESMTNGSISIWIVFFASAFLATSVGHMIYNYAVGKVGPAESAVFINLNPFFALVGATIFLGEVITLQQMIGFIFIIFGVVLGSGGFEGIIRNQKRKRNRVIDC
ncbi:DMT family transporter [Metabacillus litoralis]|uniref:DMT family transporter n=1 Tax=Metabacillus TaxID=2675233 RepID=UPI001E464906|nr:DMT family transporter [Metabacillus litoralis]MCM3162503.1 DMT family transporter [Metabacillus litoralis]MCM3411684.1 DMT family transporter [Metabacillus litoralis]UHA61190.1 DMT family transporter [Metabacillus litoralis]